jgi:hypothetical protein
VLMMDQAAAAEHTRKSAIYLSRLEVTLAIK